MTTEQPQRPRRSLRRRFLTVLFGAMIIGLLLLGLALGAYYLDRRGTISIVHRPANRALINWFNDNSSRPGLTTAFTEPCPGYPFLVPSSGLVGGLPWNAAYGPYNVFNPHPGIDIFGNGALGAIPVYAAYDGLLTREEDWTSTVIIKHADPLQRGRTIWTYYTHMADLSGDTIYIEDRFPPDTLDMPVQQGDLLGYQGVYNGGVNASRVGLHVHFSIVKSDLLGNYLNESVFENTLDPTPYLGLLLNDSATEDFPLGCLPPA